MRRTVDRLLGLIARVVRGLNRRVEYLGISGLRAAGPRLAVVNHSNGFMNVIVIAAALGRLPRFVGKATLHNVVVARPFLRLAGVVLVQRRVDGEGTGANEHAFHECHRRLARGDCIVIVPEGTTHDRESLAPIRTDAARTALGATGAGVRASVSFRSGSPAATRPASATTCPSRRGRRSPSHQPTPRTAPRSTSSPRGSRPA
jgi:1-acyl-sn-glycerol-3-phosphate acyltransferase